MDKIFFEKGKRIEAPANYHLHLENQEKVWYLEKGSMLLFAAYKKGDKKGRRMLLSSIQSGRVLLGMQKDEELEYEIFAFSEEPIVLWEMDLQVLTDLMRGSEHYEERFSSLLESWLGQFSRFLASPIEIKDKHLIFQERELHFAKGETFTIKVSEVPSEKERVFWSLPNRGSYKLLGSYEFQVSTFYPLLPYLHFLTTEDSDLHIKTTKECIEDGSWREGVDHFHRFLGHFFLKKQSDVDQKELERFQEKEWQQKETLHETLTEMASILQSDTGEVSLISSDPLIQAAQVVLKKVGLTVHTLPKRGKEGSVKERLNRLSESIGGRIRCVKLGALWWEFDSGPLLAFYGKGEHPVALIQDSFGNYEMIDPSHGKRKKVTVEIARLLSKTAYSFYTTIPDEVNSGKEALFYYLKRTKKALGKLVLYGSISALFALFPSVGIALLFNKAIPNDNLPLLLQLALGLGASALSAALFLYFRSLILGRIDGLLSSELQPALWDRMLKLPANFFRRFAAGDLLQRVMATEQMRPLLSSDVPQTMLTGLFALFYTAIMAIYSIKLTMIGLSLLVVAIGITYFCGKKKMAIEEKVYALRGQINGALVQILSGVAKLRVAGAENNAFSYWAKQFSKSKKLELRAKSYDNVISSCMAQIPLVASIIIFASFMEMEGPGKLSIGDFLAFNSAFISLSFAIAPLCKVWMQAVSVVPLWKRSHVILEEPQESLVQKSDPGKLTGNIRIDHVSFRYEGATSEILRDVSICVEPRQMVGIVGPSGSGKSTLIRLILGFETPSSGAVYFNDKDLSHLNINEVRKQMGVVLQGGGIIAGTLYQNIVAGGRYSETEIDRAITLAGFKKDLERFPMGLHTVVPMNGETLSGGQKQRLLIARALLPNPKILLLDEATSALDNHSQDLITQNIDQLDITRIVIAHRLSTIRNADKIYVIEEGRVSQFGTFAELAQQEGLFQEMLKRQKL